MAGKLYVVATPIGNSGDMTERAKRVLSEADIVAAEDTRIAQKLFNMLGIHNKLVSNHKFNEERRVDYLIEELLLGKNVAMVSDAGTPCISDPGHVLVRGAAARGIDIISVCGASSVIAALSVSGFPFVSFTFFGFFPRENKRIAETLHKAKRSGVSVYFESPKRIIKTLQTLAAELPDAELCLCNDLTKLYERIYRGSPRQVLDEIMDNPSAEKGEYTLALYVPEEPEPEPGAAVSPEALLIDYIVNHGGSLKAAVSAMQEEYRGRISRKEFYSAALNLKDLLPRLFPRDSVEPSGDEG